MKKIKSTITYHVPHWNFCNSDNLLVGGDMSTHTCKFCIKTKAGVRCALYDEPLSTDGIYIHKVRECCKATAGYESTIDEAPAAPTIEPKEIVKHTIEQYDKTVDALLAQGYPKALAKQAARQMLLGGR